MGNLSRTLLFLLLTACFGAPFAAEGNGSLPSLQRQVQTTSNSVWKLQKFTQNLQQAVADTNKRLRDSLRTLSTRVAELEAQNRDLNRRFVSVAVVDSLTDDVLLRTYRIKRSLNLYFLFLFILMLAGALFLYLSVRKAAQRALDPDNLPASEMQVLVGKVKSALSKNLKPESEPAAAEPAAASTDAVDHELPVRVAEEVFRMRLRLTRMPAETKGLTALLNAVSRLEDELNIKGYSIVDLTGQPYFDEMTVSVKEFIPQDDLAPGKRKILRMIKPQVKFNNTIVTYGEVEVAMSAEDLAQH